MRIAACCFPSENLGISFAVGNKNCDSDNGSKTMGIKLGLIFSFTMSSGFKLIPYILKSSNLVKCFLVLVQKYSCRL